MDASIEEKIVLLTCRDSYFSLQIFPEHVPVCPQINGKIILLPMLQCFLIYLACCSVTNGFRISVHSLPAKDCIIRMLLLTPVDHVLHLPAVFLKHPW